MMGREGQKGCKGNFAAIVKGIMPLCGAMTGCMLLVVATISLIFLVNLGCEIQKGLDRGEVYGVIFLTDIVHFLEVNAMSKRSRPDPKVQALKQTGTLNKHPEAVTDESFLDSEFFDPRDLMQVKYEMLRGVEVEGRSATQCAQAFGFSRPSFYQAKAAFEQGSLSALLPQRRGPKRAHKLTAEVMDFIRRVLAEAPWLGARALAQRLEERFGLCVQAASGQAGTARIVADEIHDRVANVGGNPRAHQSPPIVFFTAM